MPLWANTYNSYGWLGACRFVDPHVIGHVGIAYRSLVMFNLFGGKAATDAATLAAISNSRGSIEFDLTGKILTANSKFLTLLGYTLAEVQGRNHSMFVEPAYGASPAYKAFWDELRAGKYQAAQFRRFGKDRHEVWIEAAYNPILDRCGKVFKVVKFATDVTAQKLEYANLHGQVDAICKSQAVIEFGLDGKVLTANENFLRLVGYSLSEVQGQPHSMFVEPSYRDSAEYRAFWQKLGQGDYQAGQFKRIGKSGKEIWIEASYNPILDLNGKPFKVVKFATNITVQVALLGNLKIMIDKNFGEIDTALGTSIHQADLAVEAAGLTATRVQSMAASTEELAASVKEIANAMLKSRLAADTAHTQIGAVNQSTERLTVTSQSMGGIVQLIRNIAGQINLLALNATIESARAGEAGKGFAVVANEVKSLAKQAGNATDQIAAEIEKLQAVSDGVAEGLAQIGGSIEALRELVTGATSAVEEQSAVTQGMSSEMRQTATGVSAMNDNMTGIATAGEQVAQAVASTKEAARVLVR